MYIPTISVLSNRWIVFVSLDMAHASLILDKMWRIAYGSFVLGRWHPHFDPLKERVMKCHLWVLMPHLPFPLWNVNILEGIANTIGCYVVVDNDFHLTYDKRVA